jgi:hypothetical protein
MITPRTITSQHYPKFIRENKTLRKFAKQKKVFEKIGLKNCSESIGNGKKIVFSAAGNKGLWDIATMSMRGIASCQRWGSSHCEHLIGSMIDPYCGIIYITNGNKFKLGEKMLQRALVRFVINRRNEKPELFIERMYPRVNEDYYGAKGKAKYSRSIEARDLFKEFLSRKTKLPVNHILGDCEIPVSNAVDCLLYDDDLKLSYRDSGIEYRWIPTYSSVSKIKV